MNRALRARLEAIEKRIKPREPFRLREFRLENGLTPNAAVHTVRVRFTDPEATSSIVR